MKKLVVFVFFTILFCSLGMSFTQKLTISDIFSNEDYEVFVEGDVVSGYTSIKNGSGSIIYCSAVDLDYINKQTKIVGFTVKIKNLSLYDVLKKLKAFNVKMIDGYYYGKSSLFYKSVLVKDWSVNFQCIKNEEYILLGCPILLGSY